MASILFNPPGICSASLKSAKDGNADELNGLRTTLKKTLNKYGFDRFSLFRGLDSLAVHSERLQPKEFQFIARGRIGPKSGTNKTDFVG